MSILGAYLDWERESNDVIGPSGFVSAYVEFDNLNLQNTLNQITTGPGNVRIDNHEVELLLSLKAVTPDNVNGFIEISDALVFDPGISSLDEILPPDLRAHIRILYLGSRHNAPGPAPASATPPDHSVRPTTTGEPIFGIIDDGIGFLNSRFTCKEENFVDHSEHPDVEIKTRFIACWLQSEQSPPPAPPLLPPVSQGYVLSKTEIESYLNRHDNAVRFEPDLYAEINDLLYATSSHRGVSLATSHGTHLADIACGADCEDATDPMRNIKLLGVQVPPQSIADTAGRRLEINILQAVRWIVKQTFQYTVDNPNEGIHPLIINISLGITAGAKNGTGFLERYLKQEILYYQMLTGAFGDPQLGPASMEIILAFGNDRRSKQIMVKRSNSDVSEHQVLWRIQPDDRAASYLEIRPQQRKLSIRVKPPGETVFQGPFKLDPATSKNIEIDGVIVAGLYGEPDELLFDPGTLPVYILAVKPTGGYGKSGEVPALSPSGTWEIAVADADLAPVDPSSFEEFISFQVQRGDTPIGYRRHGRQSYLYDRSAFSYDEATRNWELPSPTSDETRESTHSSIASAQLPVGDRAGILNVGASVGDKSTTTQIDQPAVYTSIGSNIATPVLITPEHPDLSADGDDSHTLSGVLATGTLSGTTRRLSGTSVSAPQVARWRIAELDSTGSFPLDYALIRTVTGSEKPSLGNDHIHIEAGRRSARIFKDS